MKLFYYSRHIALASAVINLFSTLFLSIFISLIFYYQFGVLNPTNYKALAPNLGIEWSSTLPPGYNLAYIQASGFESFFQSSIDTGGTWWNVILPFYVLSILTFVSKSLLSLLTLYFGIRNKHTLMTTSSLVNIFIPIWGFFDTLIMFRKTKELFKDSIQPKTKISKLKELEKSIESKIQDTQRSSPITKTNTK